MLHKSNLRILLGITLIVLLWMFGPVLLLMAGDLCNLPVRHAYVKKVKTAILALARDPVATKARVAAIRGHKDGQWADGRIGVTADGYVFYYDIHESHGGDRIADVELFYFPDEQRFFESPQHFCCDLIKVAQPADKAALMIVIQRNLPAE